MVELWTLPAEELLAPGDIGVVPLVPLGRYDGPPEQLLERCRERIEQGTHGDDRKDLLAVAQVLAELKYPRRELLNLLGGSTAMIESPLLRNLVAQTLQKAVLNVLKGRFGKVPSDVRRLLAEVTDEEKLQQLNVLASRAETVDTFKEQLLA